MQKLITALHKQKTNVFRRNTTTDGTDEEHNKNTMPSQSITGAVIEGIPNMASSGCSLDHLFLARTCGRKELGQVARLLLLVRSALDLRFLAGKVRQEGVDGASVWS